MKKCNVLEGWCENLTEDKTCDLYSCCLLHDWCYSYDKMVDLCYVRRKVNELRKELKILDKTSKTKQARYF